MIQRRHISTKPMLIGLVLVTIATLSGHQVFANNSKWRYCWRRKWRKWKCKWRLRWCKCSWIRELQWRYFTGEHCHVRRWLFLSLPSSPSSHRCYWGMDQLPSSPSPWILWLWHNGRRFLSQSVTMRVGKLDLPGTSITPHFAILTFVRHHWHLGTEHIFRATVHSLNDTVDRGANHSSPHHDWLWLWMVWTFDSDP